MNPEQLTNTVKEVKNTVEAVVDVKKQFEQVAGDVQQSVNDGLPALKLQVTSKLLPKELNEFLGQANPLVELLTGVGSLIETGEFQPESLQNMINKTLYGADVEALLSNPASSVVPLHLERQQPGFLFRMIMRADGLKDPQSIPLDTTIKVQQNGWDTLINYLDRSASLSQVLPDPSITGLKVTLKNGEVKDFSRSQEAAHFVFKAQDGTVLQIKDIAQMTVTGKDGKTSRKDLWEQRKVDITATMNTALNKDFPDGNYVPPEAGKKYRDLWRSLSHAEKLSPGGSFQAGCYKTAENLAKKHGFNLRNAAPYNNIKNDAKDESFNMLSYIPNLISQNNLPPGTVFWIKKDPTISDPTSVNPAAGNHFFTYIGNVKNAAGKEEPYFADQFGFGNLTRMNFSYPKRYFHQAFVPPAAA